MTLLNGIHHFATLTSDMDRLIAFYEDVFDASLLFDMEEEGLRHAFIEFGPNTILHPFEIIGVDVPQGEVLMFARGRPDDFAGNAANEAAFRELRRRVVAASAGDGTVIDMGSLLSLSFTDPDGDQHEVIWTRAGVPLDRELRRADWTTFEKDQA